MLKTIRHPNIVKYFYSEENSPANVNVNHVKCLLITESIRPLSNLINELNKEEIIRGLFSITTAISFLHDKVKFHLFSFLIISINIFLILIGFN